MTSSALPLQTPAASDELEIVCRRFGVRRLDLLGSAAIGHGFNPERRDLDFLAVFEPRSPGDYAEAYFGLREALEVLSGRPVDLLTEAALENPYLRRRVESERRALYSSP